MSEHWIIGHLSGRNVARASVMLSGDFKLHYSLFFRKALVKGLAVICQRSYGFRAILCKEAVSVNNQAPFGRKDLFFAEGGSLARSSAEFLGEVLSADETRLCAHRCD